MPGVLVLRVYCEQQMIHNADGKVVGAMAGVLKNQAALPQGGGQRLSLGAGVPFGRCLGHLARLGDRTSSI